MNFTNLEIPEGAVTKIRDSNGNMLWRKEDLFVRLNAVTTKSIIDNTTAGYYINKEGVDTANASWQISDYIPCEPGTFDVASAGTSPSICFFDKDKNFLSGVPYFNTNPKSVTAPPKTCFCRWSVSNSSTVNSYVNLPYSNPTELFRASLMDKVINTAGEVVHDYVTGSYNYTGEVNGILIPCEGKTKVNFSGFGVTATRLLVCFYDLNDNPIANSRTKPNAAEGGVDVPEDAYGVRFSYYYSVSGSKLPNAFKNFVISIE